MSRPLLHDYQRPSAINDVWKFMLSIAFDQRLYADGLQLLSRGLLVYFQSRRVCRSLRLSFCFVFLHQPITASRYRLAPSS